MSQTDRKCKIRIENKKCERYIFYAKISQYKIGLIVRGHRMYHL